MTDRLPTPAIRGYNARPMDSEALPTSTRPKIPPRRIVALLLPAFFSLGLVVLILVWQEFNPPHWQRAMNMYLSAHVSSPREVLTTATVTVAQWPFLLAPETPFQPVSPSVHYQTEPLPADVRPDSMESLGKRPLPYPVMELYCIDLSQTDAGEAATRYLVAEHRDLHNSDWIVYIPRGWASPQAIDAAWNDLGCEPE